MAYYKCGSIYTTQNSNTVIDTASGPIANFETPLAMPLLKTRFDFKATQDLHGQSGPYPAGGGINKWDEEWLNGYLSSTDGSYISDANAICSKNFTEIQANTNYFLYKASSVPNSYVCWYDVDQTFVSRELINNSVVASPNNAKYFKVSSYGYGTTYNNNISINYPSTDTTYHPYSNICPINGWDEISVVRCGKNLFDYDESKIATGGTTSGTTRAYYPLNLDNCTLTFTARLRDGATPPSEFLNIGRTRETDNLIEVRESFIAPTGVTTRTLQFGKGNKAVFVCSTARLDLIKNIFEKYDIQIEISSNASDFEPYNGNTEVINLGGTYYGGYVSQDKDGKREITVTKGITRLGALTNWRYAQGSGVWRFQAKMPNDYKLPETISERLDFISSCFTPDLSPTIGGSVDNSITGYTNDTKVYILCNSYTDLETFLTDLSSQTLVYTLAEPFTVALPDGEPIKSLPGINNIFADTGDTSLQFRKIG